MTALIATSALKETKERQIAQLMKLDNITEDDKKFVQNTNLPN